MNSFLVLLACAACYGASDAAQTHGMNMGILTMLGVTGFVLSGCGAMIFYFARRQGRCAHHDVP